LPSSPFSSMTGFLSDYTKNLTPSQRLAAPSIEFHPLNENAIRAKRSYHLSEAGRRSLSQASRVRMTQQNADPDYTANRLTAAKKPTSQLTSLPAKSAVFCFNLLERMTAGSEFEPAAREHGVRPDILPAWRFLPPTHTGDTLLQIERLCRQHNTRTQQQKATHSELMRRQWQNPEFRAKQAASRAPPGSSNTPEAALKQKQRRNSTGPGYRLSITPKP
jgi:hypothetical protein